MRRDSLVVAGASMNVRAATAQDAAGIVALHKGSNPFGDWYRRPQLKEGRTTYEELTALERYLHGGFWMDLSLFRRHMHEYQSRGFPLLVAEGAGKIVGECEVWLDEEPPPFGRCAAVAMLAVGSPPNEDLARSLLQGASDRVRKSGYRALDLAPVIPDVQVAAKAFAFSPLWDTRTFIADPRDVEQPGSEFDTRFLAGDYAALSPFLQMNHREPARWRFETLTALWPAGQVPELHDGTKAVAVTVESQTQRFAVLAAKREWLDPGVAEVDVWMEPVNVSKPPRVREAFSIGVEIARRLGPKRLVARGPASVAKTVTKLGFSGGTTPDIWSRWSF